MKETTRSCIFCRRKGAKQSLLRFVVKNGLIVWDSEHSISGRGAYMHPTVECWSHMREIGRWEHAFRLAADRPIVRGEEASAALMALMEAVRGSIPEIATKESNPDTKLRGKPRVRI